MSSVSVNTIPTTGTLSIPASRARYSFAKSAPVPTAQRKAKAEELENRRDEMDEAVQVWFAYMLVTANELAQRFNKKPRYFLDLFFNGGAHTVHEQKKINSYNAFIAMKAEELRAGMLFFSFFTFMTLNTNCNNHSWRKSNIGSSSR
jgi:hypothetical protein